MPVKLESLKVGDYLYKTGTEIAGNTTMRRAWVREFQIGAVDVVKGTATTRGGKPLTRRDLQGMSRSPPEWLRSDVMSPKRCYFCRQQEPSGHAEDCEHPRVARRRAK